MHREGPANTCCARPRYLGANRQVAGLAKLLVVEAGIARAARRVSSFVSRPEHRPRGVAGAGVRPLLIASPSCLADGAICAASAVVVAASPGVAASLVEAEATVLQAWAEAAQPVRLAALDVGLRRLPRPEVLFALGIDRPLYLSVHFASQVTLDFCAICSAVWILVRAPAISPRAC